MRIVLSPLFVSFVVMAVLFLAGCGPDKELLRETKFSQPLRDNVASLEQADSTALLSVKGTCTTKIDGMMYSGIVGAGAENVIMEGNHFTAEVSSADVFDLANLEFVTKLELGERKKGKK